MQFFPQYSIPVRMFYECFYVKNTGIHKLYDKYWNVIMNCEISWIGSPVRGCWTICLVNVYAQRVLCYDLEVSYIWDSCQLN